MRLTHNLDSVGQVFTSGAMETAYVQLTTFAINNTRWNLQNTCKLFHVYEQWTPMNKGTFFARLPTPITLTLLNIDRTNKSRSSNAFLINKKAPTALWLLDVFSRKEYTFNHGDSYFTLVTFASSHQHLQRQYDSTRSCCSLNYPRAVASHHPTTRTWANTNWDPSNMSMGTEVLVLLMVHHFWTKYPLYMKQDWKNRKWKELFWYTTSTGAGIPINYNSFIMLCQGLWENNA